MPAIWNVQLVETFPISQYWSILAMVVNFAKFKSPNYYGDQACLILTKQSYKVELYNNLLSSKANMYIPSTFSTYVP